MTECERCGASFTTKQSTKRFCSERCRKNEEERRRLARRATERPPRPPRRHRRHASTCKDCGATEGMGWWRGRIEHPGAAGPRCHACYLTYQRRRMTPTNGGVRRLGRMPRCVKCRATVDAVDARCKQCFPVLCTTCGTAIEKYPGKPTCPSCANAKRSEQMRRRVAAERAGDRSINWRSLGERDKWKCHICGDKVLNQAGGAHVPFGATVDHLVPIALGGVHEWWNVALAHRRCNTARGKREVIVQLAMDVA
jgi:5-methylcytosine-specific restriction endonuclease McrA